MDFPRPNPDTGFGFHDSANAYWKPDDYPGYARMLREHGATWFLMWTFDENKAPWCRSLVNAGIEPIIRLGPAYMPRPNIDMSVVDAYIAAGARWFICGNEYNLFNEWSTDDNWKGFEKPLRHIAEWYVLVADQIRAKGGWPLTPPPSLGGHHLHRDWFVRFLTALQNLGNERGRSLESLLYPGGIGIHCRSVGNPLEDGPSDYDCSAREWEWFDAKVKEFVGESLPMANTEWGDEPNWSRRHNPNFDNRQKWDWWANRNVEQIKWCNPANPGYKYPDYVFANCFWILHSPPPWEDCSLIHNHPYLVEMGGSDLTPLWNALPGLVTWDRSGGQPQPSPPLPPTPPEPEPPVPDEVEFVGLSERMIEALSVSGPLDPGTAYWKVVKVEIQPQTDNQSAFAVIDAPTGAARFMWAGGEHVSATKSDPYAPPGAQSKAASMPLFNSWGSYGVEVYGQNTEALFGFGLYGDLPDLEPTHTAHHPTLVYFRLVEPSVEPPEPPGPPPPPEPIPGVPYTLVGRLAQAPHGFEDLREAVKAVAGVDMVRVKAESLAAGRIDGNDAPLFGNLRAIVLHHLGGDYYGALQLVDYAVNDNGVVDHATSPYHFIIEKSGRIVFMVGVKYLTHHAGHRANQHSISIAFEDEANKMQLDAGRFLLAALYEFMGQGWGQFRLLYLYPHSTLGYVDEEGNLWHTSCPGGVDPPILWSGPFPKLRAP